MATSVFIFNLSIVELLYCLFMLTYMIYGVLLWFNVDVGSTSGMCKFFLLGIQDIALIDGWSIALIAFTRALPNINVTTKMFWQKMCENKLVYWVIIAVWIIPILISLPKKFEADVEYRSNHGHDVGDICFVVEGGNVTSFSDVQYFTNLVNDVVLLLVIGVCYVIIYWKLRILANQARDAIEQFEDRDSISRISLVSFETHVLSIQRSLLISVGLIYVCYVILRLPLVICGKYFGIDGGVDRGTGISLWLLLCTIVYQMQFCVNFIIYAVLMANYRNAFLDIFRIVFPCCFKRGVTDSNTCVQICDDNQVLASDEDSTCY